MCCVLSSQHLRPSEVTAETTQQQRQSNYPAKARHPDPRKRIHSQSYSCWQVTIYSLLQDNFLLYIWHLRWDRYRDRKGKLPRDHTCLWKALQIASWKGVAPAKHVKSSWLQFDNWSSVYLLFQQLLSKFELHLILVPSTSYAAKQSLLLPCCLQRDHWWMALQGQSYTAKGTMCKAREGKNR